jgi:hypothetical protein
MLYTGRYNGGIKCDSLIHANIAAVSPKPVILTTKREKSIAPQSAEPKPNKEASMSIAVTVAIRHTDQRPNSRNNGIITFAPKNADLLRDGLKAIRLSVRPLLVNGAVTSLRIGRIAKPDFVPSNAVTSGRPGNQSPPPVDLRITWLLSANGAKKSIKFIKALLKSLDGIADSALSSAGRLGRLRPIGAKVIPIGWTEIPKTIEAQIGVDNPGGQKGGIATLASIARRSRRIILM